MSYGFRTGGWRGPSYRMYGGFGGFGFGLTPVVKKLIILNAALFVLTALLGRELQRDFVLLFGLVPDRFLFGFHLWQPLTYLFLHGGFLHLFFNMFALWMFGTALERDWGGRRFLKYYFLTGVGAGLFSVLITTLSVKGGLLAVQGFDPMQIPTIGASGAIYGILLAFGLLYPNVPILFMLLFPIPARVFVLIFGTLAFLSALQGPGTGVSHVAHLGGMLFGYLYLRGNWMLYRALWRYSDWRRRHRRRKFEVYMREHDEPDESPRPHDRWIH
ncbi:MAG: rhomboid family intramembrane serine protease [Terriglobia bacterium]